MNTTPPCPVGLYEFQCTLCDVDLIIYFEYSPAERGSVDSMGAPYEDNIDESIILDSVYVDGDGDILPIIAAICWDDLKRLALADLKKAYK